MKTDVIQTSFAGGEFGPPLYGRTDISQYQNACETVENFLIRPYGSAISAPGTVYVATVSDSTLRTRLIKFVFNRTDAYAIEMGDKYLRFFTGRGQVVTPGGSEDLSSYSANLKAHWKCNDNTNSTTVLDAVGSHNGTASTLTQSLTTTGIVSLGFNLAGNYHISVADHADFTRTASTQPMTVLGWFYYSGNGAQQTLFSKPGEYELNINATDSMNYVVYSGGGNSKLLLHMDGSDGSTTFTDSSSSGNTVTANGDAQIDTAQSKFGGASGLFAGSGYLTVPDSADWDFGTDDFTIDFWVRFATVSGFKVIYNMGTFNNSGAIRIGWNSVGSQWEFVVDTNSRNFSWSPSADTWYHVAITRNGTNLRMFINGTQIGSTLSDSSNITFAQQLVIGADGGGTNNFDGWLDEFRIVKGAAIWTANFTPSDSPYQGAVSNSWQVNSSISDGWHFVALVFKGDGTSSADCKIYIDASSKALTFNSDPGFINISDTTSLFRIGTSSLAGANRWNGKIDNIAFLHQEFTSTQINGFYTNSVYQLSTGYSASEVFNTHYAQLNDVIWLAHPDHVPQKLTRTSANEWTIEDFAFKGGPFLDDNLTTTTITPSGTTGTINLTVTPTNANLFTRSGSTLGHHNAYWMIGGLAQTNTTTGLQEIGYVQITNVVNSYTATATVIKNLKSTSATTVWAEGAWSSVRGYPGKVSFHDSRLWFGRTNYEPQKIWASKIYEYDNFSLDTQDDDDGLNLALVSNEANEIQWMASTKNLLTGTFGGGFVVSSGADNLAITPDNVRANEEIGIGSASIQPKRVGNFLYYLQRFKKTLRELFYVWDINTFKAVDRTILSPHILGTGALDMDVQIDPHPALYCVRTDGTLAILTREADQEFAAWSRITSSGSFTSIAVIPSQTSNYDEPWVIAERWVNGSQKKYVEYFEDPIPPDRQDQCIYLHSALTYDAYNVSSSSATTISLSASSGSVTLTSNTGYFVGANVNKRIRAIDANGVTLGEGTITATSSTTAITLSITTTFNALTYAPGYWGVSVGSVSGIDHLEAKTVGILADGITESLTRTVASGTVTLSSNYFVVHVGLAYDQVIKTLPREAGAQRGTAQGKLQRINEIAFKLNNSFLGFYYGFDADNIDLLTSVDTTLTQSLSTGTFGNFPFRGGYQRGTPIYIKNSAPLPIEILSIVSTLDTQEK